MRTQITNEQTTQPGESSKNINISDTELKKIEIILGRSLKDERGIVDDYKSLTEKDSQEIIFLAQAGSIDAINYLLYKLNWRDGLRNASSYVNHVAKNNMKIEEWISNFYENVNP